MLDEELDTLASALSFLAQAGLYPVVLHGAGIPFADSTDQPHASY